MVLDTLQALWTEGYTPRTMLDIGAHMLVYTHHSVDATGHHRNAEGMAEAISGLVGDDLKMAGVASVDRSGAWPIALGEQMDEGLVVVGLFERGAQLGGPDVRVGELAGAGGQ